VAPVRHGVAGRLPARRGVAPGGSIRHGPPARGGTEPTLRSIAWGAAREAMVDLIDPVPCGETDFLWNFAYSERDSESRHGDAWRALLGPRLCQQLDRGARSVLGSRDWESIRRVLLQVRGAYIGALVELHPVWHLARVETSTLGDLRLIAHEPFHAVAPTLRLDAFVRALDSGADTPGDRFARLYRTLRPKFEPGRSRGRPMIVGTSLRGPFMEIDGLTRLSILWSSIAQGEPVPRQIDVLVGTSRRLQEWPYAREEGVVPSEGASPVRYDTSP